MKRILLFLVFGSVTVFGQTKFGLKAGFAQAQLHGDALENTHFERRNGFYMGISLQVPSFWKEFAIQPELIYTTAGGEVMADKTSIKLNYNTLSLPILIKAKVFDPNFVVELGPEISYVMSSSNIAIERGLDKKNLDSKAFQKLNYGINMGANYFFKENWFASVHWTRSFGNILNKSNSDLKQESISENNELSNSVGRIGVGYSF